MKEFGCSPDIVFYNTILGFQCKKGRLKEDGGLLQDMKEKGLVPNRNTFNILCFRIL